MNKTSSTLLNSVERSPIQYKNRHYLLGESFTPPNMSWVQFAGSFQFTSLEIFNPTRNILVVSSSVQQKSGVFHV